MGKIVFISGTDTGAGKTVLTGLLLAHLRATGVHALAMKPFCSGPRDDAKLLFELNEGELPIGILNPFYFRRPLAPLVAARLERRQVSLKHTIAKIGEIQKKCDVLIVEGAGGIFVPLGERFMVSDLIARLHCHIFLVARNGIGVINHVLLSAAAIRRLVKMQTTVVLMGRPRGDVSVQSNPALLRELLPQNEVFEVPVLKARLNRADVIRRQAKVHEQLLNKLVTSSSLSPGFPRKSGGPGKVPTLLTEVSKTLQCRPAP